ncbi:MAG: LCP family protein [Hominilimicola sp.]
MKVRFNVKRYFQVLGISLAVIIAGAAICMGFDFSGSRNTEVVDNTSTVQASGGKINVLLMGTDVDGLRTDAIMLASIDTDKKEVNMLTIPRDTKMYIGNRYQKINAAHAFVDKSGEIGGPTATCEAVTRITGIPINYYVDFSFDAVAHVVNELGPIEFTIPDLYGDGVGMVYDDPVQSLHINLPPGKYGEGSDCDYPGLTGQQAVWLMRYRHGNVDPDTGVFKGYANGDKDRVEMQQKFIKAIVDQKVNASLILKIPSIFKAVSSEIKTNFTVNDVIKYSKYITDFTSASIHSYTLPGEYSTDSSNGDVWVPDMDEIREMVQSVFGYDASNITTGNPNDPDSTEEGRTTSSSGSSYSDSSSSYSSSGSGTGSSSGSSGNSSSGSSSSGSSSAKSSSSSNSESSSLSSSTGSSSGSSNNSSSGSSSSGTSSSLSGSGSSAESSSSNDDSDDDISVSEYSGGSYESDN